MQIILATDYAIRSLLYLALVDRMAPASEVSEKMGVPKQYLVTMSRKLRKAGMLDSAPGVAGGYYLARPAETITMLDIIRVTEGTLNLNRCTNRKGRCRHFSVDACPVRELYETLQGRVENTLDGVTLADLKSRITSARKSEGSVCESMGETQ